MYNIHDSTVYLYFFIILANKVACLLACINLVQARLEAVSLLAVLSTVGIVYHHPRILAALTLLSDL